MKRLILPLLLISTMTGCARYMDSLAYRPSVPQGNVFDQAQLDALKPGMSKREVVDVMGTPMIRDPYHASRWDYVYRIESEKGIVTQTHMALYFDDEHKLSEMKGQMIPKAH